MIDGPSSSGVQAVLAANLRRLRIARRLSLSELARATAISKATLSGIENARANPTVDTLAALTRALGVSLGELLEETPPGEMRIVRAAAAPDRAKQGEGLTQRPLEAIAPGGSLEVVEIALAARHAHEVEARPSGSRAHVYVLQGKLIAGPVERTSELDAGDYASFPADAPHVFEAVRHPARMLSLTQTPGI